MNWFHELWPRMVVASGGGYAAFAYGVSRWLTRRSPARPEIPRDFLPCRAERLQCRTSDGILLKGWRLETATPRATIALFHGLRDNRSKTLDRAAFFLAAGYRCILFDHRAHGESGGRFTSFGYHERHDVEAVARLIRSRWPQEPCAALGFSMGAAALCFAGKAAHSFDALILESVYHDLARAFQHRIGGRFPGWFRHFRRGIIWFTERRLNVPIHRVAPIAHIAQLAPRPVLLLTGSEDEHAPPHEVEALAAQLPETGRFHVIPGATHDDVCSRGGLAYQKLLLTFLDHHLFDARPARAPLAA